MLKIKDNVDLKELEKFGFEAYNIVGKIKFKLVVKIGQHEIYNIKIDDNRVLHYNILSIYNEVPDVIYDLITAGLIEKVEEE